VIKLFLVVKRIAHRTDATDLSGFLLFLFCLVIMRHVEGIVHS
jgi:hypothetical protein